MSVPGAIPRAVSAWGYPLPDWVRTLAEACDQSSARQVAVSIGVSPSIISLAINKKRKDLEFIKAVVERTLLITVVNCPVLGVVGRADCLKEQSRPFSSANPIRIRIFRACRNGCQYYLTPKEATK